MHGVWQDTKHGFRILLKKPGLTALVIFTLALGIGANAAMFSVIYAALLRPLDYKKPSELVFLTTTSTTSSGVQTSGFPVPEFLGWQVQAQTLQSMALFQFALFTYSEDQGALRVDGMNVSPTFFDVLGESPVAGRFFAKGDDRPGNDKVIVISEQLWRSQLADDPAIIGKRLRVNSEPYTVIGVARKGFHFPGPPVGDTQIWAPLTLANASLANWEDRDYLVAARMKSGENVSHVRAELQTLARAAEREHPETNTGWTATATRMQDSPWKGSNDNSLFVLQAAVLFVLLIACLNIASLMSARMTARVREVALRMALGASRARLLRQFLVEGILLSLLGGIAGILIAEPALRLLVASLPPDFIGDLQVGLDPAVLLFALALCIATGIFFGILPAWNLNRLQVASMLKEAAAGTTTGKSRLGTQGALVVCQVAASLVLLSGAGLLIRSFVALRDTDPGFKPKNVLIASQLVLPANKYKTSTQSVAFFKSLMERIRTFPGVVAVGGITGLPLEANSDTIAYEIVGQAVSSAGQQRSAVWNVVTEDYFNVMGIALIRGRMISAKDDSLAPRVALINDELAKSEFPGRDPIGQQISMHGKNSQPYQIVGVVGSTKQFDLSQNALPEFFTPYQQSPLQFMYVLVKSEGNPSRLAEPVRSAVRDLDPDQPVGSRTLEQQFDNAVSGERFYALLVAVFAGLALLLAGVGIYGVLSHLVGQRTREIGIRMALGASRGRVLRYVMARGLGLAAVGQAAGLVLALGLTRLIRSVLYHIGVNDPLTFAAAVVILAGVAALACWVPALRATQVDPMVALRHE